MVEELGELLAEEGGDDGGRGLVGAEAVGVGGAHDGGLEQAVVAIDAHQGLDDEGDEAERGLGSLAGGVEQHAGVGGEAPVAVFAAAVDAGEGLLVEQDDEAVLARHLLHQRHQEHVVVDGEVAVLEDGGKLKLVGGHLVVAGLAGDGEFEGLHLQVLHEALHAVGDGAEIVVVHLLVLGRLVAHEGAARQHQVGAGAIEVGIDEEVLLLPTEIGLHLAHLRIEIVADVGGGHAEGVERAEQGGLVVEGLARIGDEDGGDAEGVVDDEDGGGGVPGGIAAGLEGVADAAAGERTGVGLLLDEQLAREVFDHAALAVVLHKGVVLLGGTARQGLEPVGVVGDAHLHGPLLHAGGHGIGYGAVEGRAVVDDVGELGVDGGGQVFVHLSAGEHILAKILGRTLLGNFHL